MDLFRMTDTFMFSMPEKTFFGNGSIEVLGREAAAAFGKGKVLLVTDQGLLQAGLADKALASLKEAGFEYSVFGDCQPNAPLEVVYQCVEFARQEKAKIILGMGGGSSMDTAKATALFLTNSGDPRQYLGMNLFKEPGLPMIAVPTTAGTSSEITSAFVVADDLTGDKLGIFTPYALPNLSIIDPELTLKMPPRLTAETGMDAFSHALEVFVNNINSNTFSDVLTLQGMELIAKNLRSAYYRGDKNLEARYAVCLGCFTGMTGVRPCGVGIIHGVSNPVCAKYHVSHGAANALMMPAVMEFNLATNPQKFAAIATAMGDDVEGMPVWDAAMTAVEAVRRLVGDLDLPLRLRDVGVKQEDFEEFTEVVMKRSVHLIERSPRFLNKKNIMKIYELAW